MEQNEEIEIQLWEYIDGICTAADKQRIDALISGDAVWQAKYNELNAFNASIAKNLELEQPSMRFSKNVMEAISHVHIAPATKKYINYNVIRSIAALFIIAITLLLGYAFATMPMSVSQTTSVIPANILPATKFNFSSIFDNNVINIVIVVNIILGLLFIDMLLRRKRTQHS